MTPKQAFALLPDLESAATLTSESFAISYNSETGQSELCVRLPGSSEVEPIAVIDPACSYDDRRMLEKCPQLMRAAYLVIREMKARMRELRAELQGRETRAAEETRLEAIGDTKDYAAECAMKCDDRAFLVYLAERHDLQNATDRERIATRVRSILAIASRAELNTDREAAARWRGLVADFEAWRKR